MSWFNKKKDSENSIIPPPLPELPELPELPGSTDRMIFPKNDFELEEPPELPEIRTSPLPSLPSSRNQEQIKQAINPRADNQEMQISRFTPLPSPPEYEPGSSNIKSNLMTRPTPPAQIRTYQPEPPRQKIEYESPRKAEPIFVRLDKFEATTQAFDEIKERIIDIERLLAKTRELKAQEEKELEEWEREIQILKSRLDSIDKTLFKELV